jgi:hypothetical protein
MFDDLSLADDQTTGPVGNDTDSAGGTILISNPALDLDDDDSGPPDPPGGQPVTGNDFNVRFVEAHAGTMTMAPAPTGAVRLSDGNSVGGDAGALTQLVLLAQGLDALQQNTDELIIGGTPFQLGTATVDMSQANVNDAPELDLDHDNSGPTFPQTGGGVFDNVERFIGGNANDSITLRDYECLNCDTVSVPTVFIDGGAGDDVLTGISVGFTSPGAGVNDADRDDDLIVGGTGADTINPGSGPNVVYLGEISGVADGDRDVLLFTNDADEDFSPFLNPASDTRRDDVFGMGNEDVIDIREILADNPFYDPASPNLPWRDFNNFFWLENRGGGTIALVYDSDPGQNAPPGDFLHIINAPTDWGLDLQAMIDANNIQVL